VEHLCSGGLGGCGGAPGGCGGAPGGGPGGAPEFHWGLHAPERGFGCEWCALVAVLKAQGVPHNKSNKKEWTV